MGIVTHNNKKPLSVATVTITTNSTCKKKFKLFGIKRKMLTKIEIFYIKKALQIGSAFLLRVFVLISCSSQLHQMELIHTHQIFVLHLHLK